MITEEKTKISPRKKKQFHLHVMKDQQGYHPEKWNYNIHKGKDDKVTNP
jgi:hypothetical protein